MGDEPLTAASRRESRFGSTLNDVTVGVTCFGIAVSPLGVAQALALGAAVGFLLARPQVILTVGMVALPLAWDRQNVVLPAFLALLAASCLRHIGRRSLRAPSAILLVLALGVWLLASSLFNPLQSSRPVSGSDLLQPVVGLVVVSAAMLFPLHRIAFALASATTLIIIASRLVGESQADVRAVALGLNPNYVGTVAVLAALSSVAGLWLPRARALLCVLVVPALYIVLTSTQSRGAVLTLVAGLGVAFLGVERGNSRRYARVAVLAIAIPISLVVFPSLPAVLRATFFASRTTIDYQRSNDQRIDVLRAGFHLVQDHPLLGVAYGNFPAVAQSTGDLGFTNSHNEFLRLGVELGLVGLGLFVALLILGLRGAHARADPALLAVLVAMTVAMLEGNYLNSVITAYPFWLALGLSLASRDSPDHIATNTPSAKARV